MFVVRKIQSDSVWRRIHVACTTIIYDNLGFGVRILKWRRRFV